MRTLARSVIAWSSCLALAHAARLMTDVDKAIAEIEHEEEHDVEIRCKSILKYNLCPVQITPSLLEALNGNDQDTLSCISEFCEKEELAGSPDKCCAVKQGIIEHVGTPQNPGKYVSGWKPEDLTKFRNAVGLGSDNPAVMPVKSRGDGGEAVMQQLLDRDQAGHSAPPPKSDVKSSSDESSAVGEELCMCRMAGRAVSLAGEAEYKKKELFALNGPCIGACNTCYHQHRDSSTSVGVYPCCVTSSDCAPEFKRPKFNAEWCLCDGAAGRVLKSTLYDQGNRHCLPDTHCSKCKSTCSNR